MKKWERPKVVDLSLINTEQVCNARGFSGWYICDEGHCFYLDNYAGESKCQIEGCNSTNLSSYCGPTPS